MQRRLGFFGWSIVLPRSPGLLAEWGPHGPWNRPHRLPQNGRAPERTERITLSGSGPGAGSREGTLCAKSASASILGSTTLDELEMWAEQSADSFNCWVSVYYRMRGAPADRSSTDEARTSSSLRALHRSGVAPVRTPAR